MIRLVKGDLLNSKAEVLVNTVNTVGVMGKGIALRFRDAFPNNFEVYRQACLAGRLHIGELLIVMDGNLITGAKTIINFPTKTHWRKPSRYTYVEKGLRALRTYLIENNISTVAMPAPGCGNGGLDFFKISSMILEHLSGIATDVELYEPHADEP